MFNFIPWFIPTRDEQVQYRREREEQFRKQLPEIQQRFNQAQNDYNIYEKNLTSTFTNDQMELWLAIKQSAQKMMFEQGRMRHHHEELYVKEY